MVAVLLGLLLAVVLFRDWPALVKRARVVWRGLRS